MQESAPGKQLSFFFFCFFYLFFWLLHLEFVTYTILPYNMHHLQQYIAAFLLMHTPSSHGETLEVHTNQTNVTCYQ